MDVKVGYDDKQMLRLIYEEFPAASAKDVKFGGRARCNSAIYHSVYHNRRTASIVKYLPNSESASQGHMYGEVHVFVSVRDDLYALVHRFDTRFPTNITTVPAPSNPLLRPLYEKRLYGSFYSVVCESDEFVVVDMRDIVSVAVMIRNNDFSVVTDVLSYEHD